MRKVLAALAIAGASLGAVFAPTPASAAGCSGTLFGTVVDVGGAAYVDIRSIATDGYLYSIWIYVEKNGQAGLQRGGSDPTGSPDTCQESANPDMLIW